MISNQPIDPISVGIHPFPSQRDIPSCQVTRLDLRNLRRAAAIFDARSVPLVLNQAVVGSCRCLFRDLNHDWGSGSYPICFNVWNIYLYIYHKFRPNVGKYTIHWVFGIRKGNLITIALAPNVGKYTIHLSISGRVALITIIFPFHLVALPGAILVAVSGKRVGSSRSMSRAGYSTRTSAEMYLWFPPRVRTYLDVPLRWKLGINGKGSMGYNPNIPFIYRLYRL